MRGGSLFRNGGADSPTQRESRALPVSALRREDLPTIDAPPATAGMTAYARLMFAQRDVQPVWDQLMARATATPVDVGAMLDLSTILQLTGQRADGLALQADA